MPEYHISKETMDEIVNGFNDAMGNLIALVAPDCPDFEETAEAVESIGLRLRRGESGHGLLMLAANILQRAVTAN